MVIESIVWLCSDMFPQLSLAECVPCLGVMGTMYLEDVMSRVPRSPHSLQALLLSHTSSLDVPKLQFALLQLLLSAGVSGRSFDIPFVAPVVRFHVDRVTLPLVIAFW